MQRFVQRATPEQVAELRAAVNEIARTAESVEPQDQLHAKDRFYEVLFDGSASQPLQQILAGLQARVRLLRATSLSEPGRPKQAAAELAAVVDAVEAGDARAPPRPAPRTCTTPRAPRSRACAAPALSSLTPAPSRRNTHVDAHRPSSSRSRTSSSRCAAPGASRGSGCWSSTPRSSAAYLHFSAVPWQEEPPRAEDQGVRLHRRRRRGHAPLRARASASTSRARARRTARRARRSWRSSS